MKQRYGTELRSRTLAPDKPEISQGLESLLDELHTNDESKVLRSPPPTDHCSFVPPRSCQALSSLPAGPDLRSHFLSSRKFLPEPDRLFTSKIRQVASIELEESSYNYQNYSDQTNPPGFEEFSDMQHCPSRVLHTMEPPASRHVIVSQSPFLHALQ